jgi:hypothetical protein
MPAKPSLRMYSSVYLALVQLLPKEVDSRVTNMALLMVGIFGAKSVQTGKLAACIPLHIKKLSIVRRMERFLDNGAVRVRSWYEPIARWLIQAASVTGEIALALVIWKGMQGCVAVISTVRRTQSRSIVSSWCPE